MKDNTQLISGAVVFKPTTKGHSWFLVRQNSDDEWTIPKLSVRRGESSVRTAIRMMGELGGMRAKVLEEAGRSTGAKTVNGKVVSLKYLYYLMVQKAGGEAVGFSDYCWLDYSKATRKLFTKKDKLMLKQARGVLREWEKKRKGKIKYESW